MDREPRINRLIDGVYTPAVSRGFQPQGHELVPVKSQLHFPGERNALEPIYKLRGNLPRYNYDNEDAEFPIQKPIITRFSAGIEEKISDMLFDTPAIGQHRFLYGLNKFPAIVSLLLSAWILWGRGNAGIQWYDTALSISAFSLALWILLGWLYGLQNHHYNHSNAHTQTSLRIFHLTGNVIMSMIILVFAVLTLINLNNIANGTTTTVATTTTTVVGTTTPHDMTPPFSNDERIKLSAVLLGMAIMILLFSLISIVYGIYAISRIHEIRRQIKSSQKVNYSFENRAF